MNARFLRAARAARGPTVAAALLAAGCTLTPKGTDEERDRLRATGEPYEPRFEDRELPDLPADPTWRGVLSRAFLANGDLEATYFRWKSAMDGIDAAGTWPNTDVSVGYSYLFSSGNMNAFDRSTFSFGFDSSKTLSFPTKTAQAAKVALDRARLTGEQFRVAKFDLQKKVLFAWAEYVLHARTIEIKTQDLALLALLAESGARRAGSGQKQEDLLAAQFGAEMARSDLRDLTAEHDAMRAMLNALLARDPHAPLSAPTAHEPPRPVPADDAALLAAAVDVFPEVAQLGREIEGRQDALDLARMRWIPDIQPAFAFTGNVSQAVGAMITLPTTIADIRARIREAESDLRASQALLRQKRADRAGEYVSLLVTLRSAQRRADTFQKTIRPAADRIAASRLLAYEAGAGTLSDVIEARRMLLDVDLTIAQAEALIEKSVVDIECCLGVDIETIPASPTPPPAPPQGSQP